MADTLPQWIKTEQGTLVNLAHVTSIGTDECGDEFRIYAEIVNDSTCILAQFANEDEALSGLATLERLLPIAIIDMDLDVKAVTENG